MLSAYYDYTCDSHALFAGKKIAEADSFEQYLNRFHVIYLDITGFLSDAGQEGKKIGEVPGMILRAVTDDLIQAEPQLEVSCGKQASASDLLADFVTLTGRKIFFILDEWDALIREAKNDGAVQKAYLNLLRGWFKNGNFTPYVVAGAYMTGILPIKKDGSQSAISDFREYSMLEPGPFAEFTGFTENEVQTICAENGLNFETVRTWYDGYTVGEIHSVYNPYSVMSAAQNKQFRSYWKKTSAAEALLTYIDMDQDGLQQTIAELIAGESIVVNPDGFENDFETFRSRDDVLTLLNHLGYLAYEEEPDAYGETAAAGSMTGLARIPNDEVRIEFQQILRKTKHRNLIQLVQQSDQLLQDTLAGNEPAVAAAFERVRETGYAPVFYNDEQALRYAIKFAYLSCVDQYLRIEELPSGRGLADVVFIPKRRSTLPAMIVELKWNRTAETALRQIEDHHYPDVLKAYGGEVILVGVNYDEKTKEHTCRIARTKKN